MTSHRKQTGFTMIELIVVIVILGILAGYFKGWVDEAIQYVYTVLTSVPNVLLIAACGLRGDVALPNTSSGWIGLVAAMLSYAFAVIAFFIAVGSGILLRKRHSWVGVVLHIYGQIAIWLSLFVMSLAIVLALLGHK